jgi:hypothetical protein
LSALARNIEEVNNDHVRRRGSYVVPLWGNLLTRETLGHRDHYSNIGRGRLADPLRAKWHEEALAQRNRHEALEGDHHEREVEQAEERMAALDPNVCIRAGRTVGNGLGDL